VSIRPRCAFVALCCAVLAVLCKLARHQLACTRQAALVRLDAQVHAGGQGGPLNHPSLAASTERPCTQTAPIHCTAHNQLWRVSTTPSSVKIDARDHLGLQGCIDIHAAVQRLHDLRISDGAARGRCRSPHHGCCSGDLGCSKAGAAAERRRGSRVGREVWGSSPAGKQQGG